MSKAADTSLESQAPRSLSERELLARLEAILSSTLDPIITIDAHGQIISVSKSIERVFGYAVHELIGENISVLMAPPHRAAHDGYLMRYRHSGETSILGRTREFEAVRKDGSVFPIEISVSRVDVPGEAFPLFTGIIHDISERKSNEAEVARYRENLEGLVRARTAELMKSHEQLRQADRLASIGTLAAGLGHDMNNVLLPMRCRLDAVEAMNLPEAAREELAIVRRLGDYLQQLSDGLHLLALDPEDGEASQPTTDVAAWWEQVGVLFHKAVPKHARFECDFESGLPGLALPPHRLTQAVLNLVVNAGEAIAAGGLVRVWARLDEEGQCVRVGVTDDGRGMSSEVSKRAFDPFFTTKSRGLGTGMGLSLVRGVAQSSGGTVSLDSEPGRGTTISLALPIAHRADANTQGERRARLSLGDTRLTTLIATMLGSEGFVVEAGADGDAAAAIWIVETDHASLHAAKEYLRAANERQLIVCGPTSAGWDRLDIFHIEQVDDFDEVRRVLRDAIDAYEGASK